MIENGLNPEDLLGRGSATTSTSGACRSGKLLQRIDLGDEHQMVLEVTTRPRPAQDLGLRRRRDQRRGPVGVGVAVAPGRRAAGRPRRSITIPAEPADATELPPALQPFGAVPPLVTDIDLSVDDRWLYVSCWGTGELKQYDVSDPHNPRETGSVRLGGIVGRSPHPAAPELPLAGAPQMVEISRDGRRVYVTNSLYASWDDIFYPDGVGAWMAKLDADTDGGGMSDRPAVLPARRRLPRPARAPDPAPGRRRVERLVLLRRLTGVPVAGVPAVRRVLPTTERGSRGWPEGSLPWPGRSFSPVTPRDCRACFRTT